MINELIDDPEDQDLDPIPAAPDKKKRGRPRNQNYLSWNEAREAIRDEMLPSRGKYFEWWDRHKPKAIPRFPYRVYQEDWTSWNDFLGTNNKFNDKIGTRWRPFLEAVQWANTIGLKSQQEWLEYCRTTDEFPADIPARPDVVYDKWRSWTHWLGSKPVQAIETRQELAQKIQVYYIIKEEGAPGNVLTYGVEPAGQTALKSRWERERFEIVRLFWYDPSKAEQIRRIVEALSSPYLGETTYRLTPNVWEIVYHLQMHLDVITRPSA